MTELSHFPRVLAPDGTVYYGGSQDWFRNKWRALSGCASVSAVNLAAFYGIGFFADTVLNGEAVFSQALYRKEMNFMFRRYMTSGMMGFPDPVKYTDRFKEFALARGYVAVPFTCDGWKTVHEAVSFTEERLKADRPVALLILGHRHKEIDDITWHWMTITGMDEGRNELVVSNYGKRETWPADVVFEVSPHNRVHLISFDIARKVADDPV